jgi:RNA polymerase sigma factor (sigma-70 family)
VTTKGSPGDWSRDEAEKLFLDQLETIERAIRFACRNRSIPDDDAEDFASYVKLKLVENDYGVIRKHERHSNFAAFISIVIQRLLLDYRNAQWGKWHASAAAKRIGEPAMTIEALLHRDGRSIEEIIPLILRRWPELTRGVVESIAEQLPRRNRRPRAVGEEIAAALPGATASSVHERAFESERSELSRRIASVVRATMRNLDERDRLICRLRFEGGLSIAEIARLLQTEPKPLYRRMQRALALLRNALEAQGIGIEETDEVLSTRDTDLDFGFAPAPSTTDPTPEEEGS